jgi:hypothetical protein
MLGAGIDERRPVSTLASWLFRGITGPIDWPERASYSVSADGWFIPLFSVRSTESLFGAYSVTVFAPWFATYRFPEPSKSKETGAFVPSEITCKALVSPGAYTVTLLP